MSESTVLTVATGFDAFYEVDAIDESGSPVPFYAADTPSAVVWSGADSGPVFTPVASWVSATAGKILLAFPAAITAGVPTGTYPVEVFVTTATGFKLRVLDAWVQVTSSPGTRAAPPVYSTFDDLVLYGGGEWLQTIRHKSGLVSFATERARARSVLDRLIARKFRNSTISGLGGPNDAVNFTISAYLAADYQPFPLPGGLTLAPGQTILIVDDQVKELCSLKALQMICWSRVGLEDDDKFLKRSGMFRLAWERLLTTATLQLDLNADGFPDYAWNMGALSLR